MGRRRKTTSSLSTVKVLGAIVVLLGILVAAGILLAPEKPPAPPVSVMSYEERPESREGLALALDDGSLPSQTAPGREVAAPQPEAAQQEGEGESGAYSFAGTVTDSRTRETLAGLHVRLRRQWSEAEKSDWQSRERELIELGDMDGVDEMTDERRRLQEWVDTETGADGRYRANVSSPGDYSLTFWGRGYMTTKVDGGHVDMAVPERVVDVALSSGASISGRVLEYGTSFGVPDLPVFTVEARDSRAFLEFAFDGAREYGGSRREGVRTDADGNYTITGLRPEDYGVWVGLGDSSYRAGSEIPFQRVTIRGADEEVHGIDFRVEVAGTVWGYVLTPDDEPIDEVALVLVTSDSVLAQALSAMLDAVIRQTLPIRGKSESDGYYELMGVPLNEEWRIYAMARDHSPQLADPFMLTGSARSAHIDIYLFSGTTVYGRVEDPDRAPIEGAEVYCLPGFGELVTPMHSPHVFRNATSDASGRFELAQLPRGDYQIFAAKDGYKYSMKGKHIHPDGFSDLENVRIVLDPVDLGDHSIYGTVSSEKGNPIDGARVELGGLGTESLNSFERTATTDFQGEFRIDGLEIGMYMVSAEKEGYAPRVPQRALLDQPTDITLVAASIIRGRVLVRETGQPLGGQFTVSAAPAGNREGSSFSILALMDRGASRTFQDEEGRFELSLGAGVYRLEGSAPGYAPGRVEVVAEAGERVEGILLYLSEAGGRIEGRVVTGDGKSPQGAMVTLIEANSASQALVMLAVIESYGAQAMRVGADGVFSFEKLPEGTYSAIAQHPSYARGESGLITLGENARVTGVEVRLGTGGAVEGYVYRDGRAVAEATVVVLAAGVPSTTTTDAEGYYRVDGLATGTHQVTALIGTDLASLADTRGAFVDVEEGLVTRHDFGDATGIRIEGHCEPPPELAGLVFVRPPGSRVPRPGEEVAIEEFSGISAIIGPGGNFVLQDVQPGEWQLDIVYTQFPSVVYVHTEFVAVTAEDENLSLELEVSLF